MRRRGGENISSSRSSVASTSGEDSESDGEEIQCMSMQKLECGTMNSAGMMRVEG